MTKRLLMAVLTIGLLAAMLPGVALANDNGAPNQGDPSKVVKVEAPWGCCDPIPGNKVEGGNLGRYEKIWSYYPIDFVTVKSGNGASFWLHDSGYDYGKYWVEIKGTKDISNYVVWTCPCVVNDDV